MGILDKIKGQNSETKKQNAQPSSEFSSIIIDTTNVIKEIKNIATANRLNASELSFKLLKVTTYMSDEKSENHEMSAEEMSLFLDDTFLLNPSLKISQNYRVEIFKTALYPTSLHLPDITLSGNKNLTKVIATISQSHDVVYTPDLEQAIIDDIQIKKMKTGILLGIRDQNMYKEVKNWLLRFMSMVF